MIGERYPLLLASLLRELTEPAGGHARPAVVAAAAALQEAGSKSIRASGMAACSLHSRRPQGPLTLFRVTLIQRLGPSCCRRLPQRCFHHHPVQARVPAHICRLSHAPPSEAEIATACGPPPLSVQPLDVLPTAGVLKRRSFPPSSVLRLAYAARRGACRDRPQPQPRCAVKRWAPDLRRRHAGLSRATERS